MLKIKYFEKFKNDEPFIVITSDKEGLEAAYNFFKDQHGTFLNDNSITEFCEIEPLEDNNLYLNYKECEEIAVHFKNLYDIDESRHAYFDTEALGDDIEIIISYEEHDNLF